MHHISRAHASVTATSLLDQTMQVSPAQNAYLQCTISSATSHSPGDTLNASMTLASFYTVFKFIIEWFGLEETFKIT